MSSWSIIRLVHVLLGFFWAGNAVFIASFLLPSVRAAGPGGGAVMGQIMRVRRLPPIMLAVSLLTVLTGLGLYHHVSAGFRAGIGGSSDRVWLLVGAVAGTLAWLWGLLVQAPAAMKLGAAAAAIQGPPTPEQAANLARLQLRLQRIAWGGAALVVLALVGMALSHPA